MSYDDGNVVATWKHELCYMDLMQYYMIDGC